VFICYGIAEVWHLLKLRVEIKGQTRYAWLVVFYRNVELCGE
jgi:hypothetical protein